MLRVKTGFADQRRALLKLLYNIERGQKNTRSIDPSIVGLYSSKMAQDRPVEKFQWESSGVCAFWVSCKRQGL